MKILALFLACLHVTGFAPLPLRRSAKPLLSVNQEEAQAGLPGEEPDDGDESSDKRLADYGMTRRRTLQAAQSLVLLTAPLICNAGPARALVKGVAPPPPKSKSDKPKCTNVEDCQAQAEKRQQEEAAAAAVTNAEPPKTTPGGTRYRDLEVGR